MSFCIDCFCHPGCTLMTSLCCFLCSKMMPTPAQGKDEGDTSMTVSYPDMGNTTITSAPVGGTFMTGGGYTTSFADPGAGSGYTVMSGGMTTSFADGGTGMTTSYPDGGTGMTTSYADGGSGNTTSFAKY